MKNERKNLSYCIKIDLSYCIKTDLSYCIKILLGDSRILAQYFIQEYLLNLTDLKETETEG